MKVFSIAKGFHFLSKRDFPELTEKELNRLRAVVLYRSVGRGMRNWHVGPLG